MPEHTFSKQTVEEILHHRELQRKSFDSLAVLVSGVVCQNPQSGNLFAFLNRATVMPGIIRLLR